MRFFTTEEGEGKGTRRPLASSLMIVGRSKNADLQIEDALVSRRHLEVRVEGDTVFVENKSTHGSFLNGKPLVGVVSLNPGDVLDIGHTKLRYEEAPEDAQPTAGAEPAGQAQPAEPVEPMEANSSEIDGTRIADGDAQPDQEKDKDASPDATRAVVDDHTRMLNQTELPNWAAQERKAKAASSKGALAGFLIAVVLLAAGGLYWYMVKGGGQPAAGGSMAYRDSLYGFNLEYPVDWPKVTDETGVIEFGFGGKGDKEWARLTVHTDKEVEHALTGLTDGFDQYQKVLKQRYDGFELLGNRQMAINGVAVIFYGFDTSKSEGKGIFVLNAENRIAVECVGAEACYGRYSPEFNTILQSFRLSADSTQQFIDFPMPDEGMQHLALADPAGLSRQIQAHAKLAEMLLANKDVKPDSLYQSVQEYRKAMQLAIAPPQHAPAYHDVAQRLLEATRQFNSALNKRRFEINLAMSNGDYGTAFWEANKMMQMVPDKTDPAYQEAFKVTQSLQRPRGQ